MGVPRLVEEPLNEELTKLLRAWGEGDRRAGENLFPLIYEELRRVARRQGGASGRTVHPTALVHEAFIELANAEKADWRDRRQFFAFAAVVMRRRVVDHARRKGAGKRGGGLEADRFDEQLHTVIAPRASDLDFESLDEALGRLEALDPEQARLVELRFFAGLSVDETAECLGISPRTVAREWGLAKAWLAGQLRPAPAAEAAEAKASR